MRRERVLRTQVNAVPGGMKRADLEHHQVERAERARDLGDTRA